MSTDIITWLRGPEGEQWSRERHDTGPVEINHDLETWWRATGPLIGDDPCGAGPVASASSTNSGGPS